MVCSGCGREMPAHLGRCSECGTGLTAEAGTSVGAPASDAMPTGGFDEPFSWSGRAAVPAPAAGDGAVQTAQVVAAASVTPTGHVAVPPTPSGSVAGPPTPTSQTGRATGPLSVGQSFGRYHIIRVLGVGGMGVVYQAWDEQLEVAVAIKVIRPQIGDDPAEAELSEKRFKRELVLARQVTHRNVVRIHDLGEIDGIKYITMPYIQGANLEAVIKKAGKLPVQRALVIAKQIASGLQAAHDVGIVHRDFKPANILIPAEDHALITDFGIARSVSAATVGTVGVIGTIEYMAPEQARGMTVDQRADIYAFGLVLRDALIGHRAAPGGETGVAELMTRMLRAPARARTVEPSIPEAVDEVIDRCLQPDPEARYKTTRELVAALDALDPNGHWLIPGSGSSEGRTRGQGWASRRRMIGIAAAVLLAISAVTWLAVRGRLPASPPTAGAVAGQPVTLAILPFRNASGDQTLDWLGGSLVDMLRTDIGQSAQLRIVSSNRLQEMMRDLRIASDSNLDPATLRRLASFSNAETVVWGVYLKYGNEIRFDATLEDLTRQRSVALKAAAPGENSLLAAVAQLADAVRSNLALAPDAVKELQAKAVKPSSASVQALRYFDEGLQLARQGKHADALKSFEAATHEDADFALAYSKLGQEYGALGYDDNAQRFSRKAVDLSGSLPPQERYVILAGHAGIVNDNARAIEAYENLAKVSPDDPEVQFTLAALYEASGSFDQAREYYRAVLARDPNYVDALFAAGRIEIQQRNPQGALEYLNRALTLAVQVENDEAKGNVLNAIGVAYKRLNKFDEALRNYQQSLEIKRGRDDKRGIALTLGEVASVYNSLGKPDLALSNYTDSLRLHREIGNKKGIGTTLINFGRFYEDRAQYNEALKLFKEALQIERDIGDKNYEALCLDNIGGVYTFKGEFDDARTYFERALELREELKVPGNIADTLHNLAETFTRIGNYDEALTKYLRALELRRSAGDKRGAAIESYSLGTIFEQQGRYGAALKSKEEALNGFRELHDRSLWLGEILSGYGHGLGQSGRNAEAEKVLTEALDVAREVRGQGLIAQTLNFLGDNASYRGDGKAASSLFEQALKEASRTSDRYLVLLSKANVASALVVDKRSAEDSSRSSLARPGASRAPDVNLKKAIDSLGEVGREAERLGFKYLSLECAIDLSEALLYAGDLARAQRELERATVQTEKLGLRTLRAKAEYLLASERRLAGNQNEAARHGLEARRLLIEIGDEAQSDLALKRADLAPMLQDSPPPVRTPRTN